MYRRLVFLVLLVLVAGAVASWLAIQPGMLQLEWLGYNLQMRTSLGVALLVILGLMLIFADRLVRGLFDLPGTMGRRLARRRAAQGHRALALGMIAVSAGEPGEARRQAARAQRLLSAPQLTDLLSAQAANLSGDSQAAGRYFSSLTRDPDTAFLGHIGLARLALEQDMNDEALAEAKTALALRPKSALAARQVLVLQAERQNWAAALPALNVVAAADDDDDRENLARQRAVLNYLQARSSLPAETGSGDDQEGRDDPVTLENAQIKRTILNQLQAALKDWPAFWPAALCLADIHLAAKEKRKAVRVLETAFRSMPHEMIAARLQNAWNSNEGTTVSRLAKLVATSGDRAHDARRIVAGVALANGLVGEARRLIAEIPDTARDAAVWRLAAMLAESGDEPDMAAATDALRQAGDARRGHCWQCTSCQLVHDSWQAHCDSCAGFATLDWRRPDGLSPLVDTGRQSAAITSPAEA